MPSSTGSNSSSGSSSSLQSADLSMKTKLPNIPESQQHFLPAAHAQVGSSDRNAYLEGISRIIARREWFALHKKLDKDLIHQFEYLLETTLDCCVYKLQNYKQVPLSLLSFIGKVFAYLFFHIPEVGKALMFLLGTKLSQLDRVKKCFFEDDDYDEEETANLKTDMRKVFAEVFPPHLHEFIDFQGNRANTQLTRGQRTLINSVPPPKHPVRGIKDPNGIWVKRWNSYDSDIFCSFFRHYINIIEALVGKNNVLDYQTLIKYCPGLCIITAHISQNIKNVIYNRPMLPSPVIPANISIDLPPTTKASPLPPTPPRGSNGNSSNGGGAANENVANSKYSSLVKIFNVLRDALYNSNSVLRELIHIIDAILISEAKTISVYDVNKVGPVFGVVYEFASYIDGNPFGYDLNWTFWLDCNFRMLTCTDHIQLILRSLSFIFNSWDLIPNSFNFSPVPDLNATFENQDENYPWILFAEYGDKLNFSHWLVSQDTFEKFFIHWHPIVRSYYIRLLVWRMIGVNNLEDAVQIDLISELNFALSTSFDSLIEHSERLALSNTRYSFLQALNFKIDSPLANRRLTVMAIRDEYLDLECFHDLRKTHPFEIFDEAVYTCLALTDNPLSNSNNAPNNIEGSAGSLNAKAERSKGLVNSLGKFFKGLTVKGEQDVNSSEDSLGPLPASTSISSNGSRSTSLGNLGIESKFGSFTSLILRSPSPSLFSFNLDPTSLSLFSSEDDDESDIDKVSSSLDEIDQIFAYGEESYESIYGDSSSPSTPKSSQSRRDTTPASRAYSSRKTIFKSPPDVIRPIYKIDIVLDHDSFNDKIRIVNNSARGGYPWVISLRNQYELPPEPMIPNISIFITNDPFNKFLIQEEYMIFNNGEDQNCQTNGLFQRKLTMNEVNNLGKSLFEYHKVVEEFKFFLQKRVEFDHLNSLPTYTSSSASKRDMDSGAPTLGNGFQGYRQSGNSLDEATYLKRIMPNLCIDTEMGFANAG